MPMHETAATGIKILASLQLNRRQVMTIAVSLGLGLGISMVPDVLQKSPLIIQNIFNSAPATSGITAMILSFVLSKYSSEPA